MAIQTAHELLIHELQDMLSAERQLIDALQEQAENATNPELKKGFEQHRAQTQKQVERLTQCFEEIGEEPKEVECKGIEGLIEEYKTFIEEEDPSDDIIDVVSIGAASKVESYEINAYESLIQLAESMGHNRSVRLLNQNLREEEQTKAKLEKLSKKIEPEQSGMQEEEEESAPAKKSPGKKRSGRRAA